jgi:signal transduction histidine kinase
LLLLVADDGVGFDVEEARLAAGLGLISMRERIHLAGGEFAIASKLGEGMRITAKQ